MIEINYDRKKCMVTVSGHAQSGEMGHDLVCAAVSILVYTLAANINDMGKDSTRFHKPKIAIEPGKAKIQCRPISGMKAVTALMMDSICVGFDIIAQKYPENVLYSVL